MTRPKLNIGTRGSKLAVLQAESVAAKIKELNHDCEISIVKIVTTGDRQRRIMPDSAEDTGVFVKELEEALLNKQIDIAVHSLKDMPTEISKELCLLAVTERVDPRDVLIAKLKLDELPQGARIGTGSLRRSSQLKSYRPDLKIDNIKGNVDTRLRKVYNGEFDGVILAAAAIVRLGWQDKITQYLPLERFLPAVGQGALAIESRLGDEKVIELISPVNHLPTWQSITAERAFLKALGGGCRNPIAALGTVNGASLKLEGMVANINSNKMISASLESGIMSPEELGKHLAEKMLGMRAGELLDLRL